MDAIPGMGLCAIANNKGMTKYLSLTMLKALNFQIEIDMENNRITDINVHRY